MSYFLNWWRSSAALECSPVTGEVAGSSPVVTAKVLVIFFINYKWDLSSIGLERLICNQEAASSKLAGSTKREWLTTKQQCLVNDVGSLNIISFLRMKGGAPHL